ncbi:abasic site processing protein HMCES isoform X2 [Thrips palmi]|nr:abasic site processing protein HMCES isoform X2 [Thrips palmi]
MDYRPSVNLAPTDITPVLVNASHFDHKDNEPVIYPMMWGMIPPWHKGDIKSHGLSTNNCRLENMNGSKLYSPAFSNGRRCVVLCEGFYEWQTTKKESSVKQPYYIYAPQNDEVKVEDPGSWDGEWSETEGWKGPKLLKMAGLFSCWTSSEGKPIYSYSVITMEANATFSWLHHRMPAILNSDEEVMDWIDCGRVPSHKALQLLKPVDSLSWHPVSTAVNNSRNKSDVCNKPVDLKKPKPANPLMMNWLKKANKPQPCESDDTLPEAKRLKKETD